MPYTPAQQRLLDLLRERAVKRGEFVLSSGQKSNYYIDGRLVTLDGEGARAVAEAILEKIRELELAGAPPVAAVGGLTMGADPIAGACAAISAVLGRPRRAFIVRKETKKHGTQKLVEGPLAVGEHVVIVEDVVSTGASAIQAAASVREMGCHVTAVITLVDREMGGPEEMAKAGLRYIPLFTKTELLAG